MKYILLGLIVLGSNSAFAMNCKKAEYALTEVEHRLAALTASDSISKNGLKTIVLSMLGIQFRSDAEIVSCSSYLADVQAVAGALEELKKP